MASATREILERYADTPFYEDDETPEIEEIVCPLRVVAECMRMMDRNAFASHLSQHHADHHDDPEPFFEDERHRMYGGAWNFPR